MREAAVNEAVRSDNEALRNENDTLRIEIERDSWMSISESIMILLSNENIICKRTAMCVIICIFNDKSHSSVQMYMHEDKWIREALPQIYRVVLSIEGLPAARYEAAECIVLLHIYYCRRYVYMYGLHNTLQILSPSIEKKSMRMR